MPLGEYSQQFKTTLSKGLLKKFRFELLDQELTPSQLLRNAIIKYFADKEETGETASALKPRRKPTKRIPNERFITDTY